jgi:RNA polymerase sigma-70 factor (sigma-E family)
VTVPQTQGTEGYAEVVAARAPALLRLAVMLTGDRVEAEDLLQATLARTQRHAPRIATMGAPAAYLRRAMIHEHLSGLRRLGRRVRTTPLEGHDVAVDATTSVELRDATWRLLSTLPRQQRAVLVLRFYEDLPDREIAEMLGCGEPTVRSNASRGLATLRARLTQPAPTEEATP